MSIDALPVALQALLALVAGYRAGLLHFRALARVAEGLLAGRLTAVGLQLARLAALGMFLWLCAMAGPLVLIGAAAGVLIGRARALGEVR